MRATADQDETGARRSYRSRLRAQQSAQTRQAVLEAAHELFTANGWAATGMRDIAASAGVALETVYSHFSSKRGVLSAVVDAAVAGDDAPIALAERPEFLALGHGRRPARIRAAARLLTALYGRTARIDKLLREAAHAEKDIAELLSSAHELQRRDVAAAFELMVGRPPSTAERDGAWVIASPEVYLLLIEGCGWRPEQYEAWIAQTLERSLPRS